VEIDGRLTNFKIERKLWPEFDAEALRVIRLSPRWIPGMENDRPVRVKYTVPINFAFCE
jgi:periplasmic protein TonB